MPVRVEKKGPVTTVVLHRPEVRNAVDRIHADALADAFRAFDADDEAHVAVLFGEGGNFCAGRRSEGARRRRAQPRRARRRRADGTDAHPPRQAGHRCRRWIRRRRRARARHPGATCASSRMTRPSASSAVAGACRSSTAARCGCRGLSACRARSISSSLDAPFAPTRRWRLVWPIAWCRVARRAPPPRRWPHELAALPQLCLRHDRLSAHEQLSMSLTDAMDNELKHGWASLAHASEGVARFTGGAGRHGRSSNQSEDG